MYWHFFILRVFLPLAMLRGRKRDKDDTMVSDEQPVKKVCVYEGFLFIHLPIHPSSALSASPSIHPMFFKFICSFCRNEKITGVDLYLLSMEHLILNYGKRGLIFKVLLSPRTAGG